MKNKANISDHLLISYLNQTISVDEKQLVDEWLAQSSENQLELEKLELAWKRADGLNDFEAIDLNKNWVALQRKMGSGNKKSGLGWHLWKYAAAVLLIATVAFLLLRPQEVLIQQMAAYDDQKEVVLSDGTVVWLNKGASLDYPETFSSDIREVSLKGEAFFDVTHNPDKPFVVTADGTTTEVLGTTFTIAEKEGQELKLILATGKVRFTKNDQQATLTPGQMIEVDSNGIVTQKDNHDRNFMSWKTRKLTFENTLMKEVIGDISKLYGIVLEIKDEAFLTCPLTTTFQDEPLEDVLETIELLFNIEIQQNGQLYQLIGKGCKQQ